MFSKRRPQVAHILGFASYSREMRWKRGFFIEAVVSSIWSIRSVGAEACRVIGKAAMGIWFTGVVPGTLPKALSNHSALPRAGGAAGSCGGNCGMGVLCTGIGCIDGGAAPG